MNEVDIWVAWFLWAVSAVVLELNEALAKLDGGKA